MEIKYNSDFESSLKTLETENFFDRTFYRPIGYQIAKLLQGTGITPNMVTIVSIFFGVAASYFFYPANLVLNLIGIILLIIANTLDCVDGQLARMTGIKSPVGRILDGLAGDLWFISIYVFFALRLTPNFGAAFSWTLVALAGVSNLVQANIVDYYKTLHLYFISVKKGAEFETVEQVKAKYAATQKGFNRMLTWLYLWYTILQTKITPKLQKLLSGLHEKYGVDFPNEIRTGLRAKSLNLMPMINLITFNWRSVVMFLSVIFGQVWIYLLWEIIVLNIILFISVSRHEKMCKTFIY